MELFRILTTVKSVVTMICVCERDCVRDCFKRAVQVLHIKAINVKYFCVYLR